MSFLPLLQHLLSVSMQSLTSPVCPVPLRSPSGRVGGDRRGGRGPPGDELVAFRFSHGVHHRGRADARLPHRLHRPLHSSR